MPRSTRGHAGAFNQDDCIGVGVCVFQDPASFIKVIVGYVEDALETHALTLALLGTVFDVGPVLGPFLAPLKWQPTALTDLGLEPVLGLGYWGHVPTLIGTRLFEGAGSLDL